MCGGIASVVVPIAAAALGGWALGPVIAGGLGASAGVGMGIGAGLGYTAGGLVTGQPVGQAVKGGVLTGLGTFAGSEIGNMFGPNAGGVAGSSSGGIFGLPTTEFAGGSLGGVFGPFTGAQVGGATGSALLQGMFGAPTESGGMQPFVPISEGTSGIGAAEAPINLSRPSALAAPTWASGMSDVQQRTATATGSTQGSEREGLSQMGENYYTNLLQRNLIAPSGELGDYAEVRPVEHQYLQQGLGLQYEPTTKSLLESIVRRQRRRGMTA